MNFNGEDTTQRGGSDLDNGGIIDGSLEIKDDLIVDGNTQINGDLSIEGKLNVIDEIQVEDSIITLAVGNQTDALNTGLLLEHDVSQYAGLVRRSTDKKFVLLNDVTPKPGPLSAIPSSDGTLEVNELEGQIVSASEINTPLISSISGVAMATPQLTLAGNTIIQYTGIPNQGIISGLPGQYIIQADQKMVIRGNNGDLELDAEGNGNVIISSDGGNVNITALDSSGTINLTSTREINLTSDNTSININAIDEDIELKSDRIILNSGTGVYIGEIGDPNLYRLPVLTGSLGQVLTKDLGVGSSWQDPAPINDQSLNTTDNVSFAQVNVGTVANGFTLPSTRGSIGQYMRQNAAGLVSWADIPSSAHGVMSMVGNALPTSFAASGTYTQIVGTRTGSQLKDFVFAPNVLQYTGSEPAEFLVNVSQSWIHATGTPDEFRLAIFKNGIIVASSEQRCNLDSDTDYPRSSSTNAVVSLANGDQIDVRVANFDDTTTVAVIDHTFSIIKVGLVADAGASNPFNQDLNTTDSPEFAGLTVPTLAAPVDDIDVSARELTIQNPVAGSTLLEIRSNGSGDSVLAFNEGVSGVWEIYKTVTNDLAIANSNSGDDVMVFSNSTSNSISIKKELFIGDTTPYKMPTARGNPSATLVQEDSSGTVIWKDKSYAESYFNNNSTNTTFSIIGAQTSINGSLIIGNQNGAWSLLGTEVRYDGLDIQLFKVEISFSVRNIAAVAVPNTEYIFEVNQTGTNLPEATRAFSTFENNYQVIHCSFLTNMSTNDKIEPKLTNLSNLISLAVPWLCILITPV